MKHPILLLLIICITTACDTSTAFQYEITSIVENADDVKIKYSSDSIIIVSNTEIFKELLKPNKIELTTINDKQSFPIEIVFFNNNEQSATVGIEFGHARFIHYKTGSDYKYKTMLTDSLDTYLFQLINEIPKR